MEKFFKGFRHTKRTCRNNGDCKKCTATKIYGELTPEQPKKCMDAKRRRGIVGFVGKGFGAVCQNHGVILNLIQGLSMFIKSISIDRCRIKFGMTVSCAKRTEKNLLPYSPILLLPSKKVAFTLAEVLITLGIIGVVAALTLPSVISNHHKKQTLVKLRVAYNTLNEAIRRSVADNGDIINWDYVNEFDNVNSRKAFTDKYIIPYIKDAKPSAQAGVSHFGLGYPEKYQPRWPNGYVYGMTSGNYYPITKLNGIYYIAGGVGVLSFNVDLNGVQKPNIWGKDLFSFVLVPEKNIIKPATYQYPYKYNDGQYVYCKENNASGCAWVIEKSGWKIPDDYPIRF